MPLKKNNAILFKTVIETVRAGNSIWTILIGLVILGALVFRTPLFAGLPFIGDPIVLWLTLFVGKPTELHGADGTLGVGVGLGNAC